jgi:diguanylate cyclase (GGDEF)-like protein
VSFRARLTLFFVLIVVLPMAAVAILVTEVASESQSGKSDARLATAVQTALSLYRDGVDAATEGARQAGRDPALAEALRSGDAAAAQEAVRRLSDELDVASLTVEDPSGRRLASAGAEDTVATSEIEMRGPEGPIGTVAAAGLRADAYVDEILDLTGSDAAVLVGDEELAGTVGVGDATLPEGEGTGDVDLPGGESRVATVSPGAADPDVRVALFGPRASGGLAAERPLVAGVAVAFFVLAVLFVVLLVRTLQRQVQEMFGAARRVGAGDFSQKIPVEGDDEMAGLAREFNKMSERVSDQMDELRRQRVELDRAVKRIGEAFAAGLDRETLLEIVGETALAACDATTARVVLTGRGRLEVNAGESPEGGLGEALQEAEQRALEDGGPADSAKSGAQAVAQPLTRGGGRTRNAVMVIGRVGPPFDAAQRELLRYLAGQAAASVENIDLHEIVSEQAITDELTGLSNSRRFRELIDKEVERAERFGHDLSLVLLDIDDFKQVNDTHGHLQGDEVLREVARILREESRGVDEPARYGGEEFVVALPETGSGGAVEVAERIRTRVEEARIAAIEGSGTVRVTASLGVASIPGSAQDVRGLISAADSALYRAKGAGKNCTELAVAMAGGVVTQGEPAERRT